LRQQLELLIIPFYILVCPRIFIKWSSTETKFTIALSLEREAYAHEGDIGFFKKEVFWFFLIFLKNKLTNKTIRRYRVN
jgi:hypothetical protein